jgi:hypothetical protein
MTHDDVTPRLKALGDPKMRRSILTRVGMLAVHEAKALVPVKTGNLRRTIRLGPHDEAHALIYAGGMENVGYAAAVEFGTSAHEIRPLHKKALAFASQHALDKSAGLGLVRGGSKLKFRLSGSLSVGSQRRYGNAAYTVVRHVHHPGTRKQPYLVPGAKAAMRQAGLRDDLVKAWNDAS